MTANLNPKLSKRLIAAAEPRQGYTAGHAAAQGGVSKRPMPSPGRSIRSEKDGTALAPQDSQAVDAGP